MGAHDHAHSHGHDHSHDHQARGRGGHSHAPALFGKAFAIGTALNTGFVVAQVFFGLAAHSVALPADAVHNLGDVLGLLIAWGAAVLAKRHPTQTRTYGWGRSTILASLINAVVLLFGCGAIAFEAVRRFNDPAPVGASTVMWVAALGIVINGATALLFMRGRKGDLNMKGALRRNPSASAPARRLHNRPALLGTNKPRPRDLPNPTGSRGTKQDSRRSRLPGAEIACSKSLRFTTLNSSQTGSGLTLRTYP